MGSLRVHSTQTYWQHPVLWLLPSPRITGCYPQEMQVNKYKWTQLSLSTPGANLQLFLPLKTPSLDPTYHLSYWFISLLTFKKKSSKDLSILPVYNFSLLFPFWTILIKLLSTETAFIKATSDLYVVKFYQKFPDLILLGQPEVFFSWSFSLPWSTFFTWLPGYHCLLVCLLPSGQFFLASIVCSSLCS